jgi:hypothetical protein
LVIAADTVASEQPSDLARSRSFLTDSISQADVAGEQPENCDRWPGCSCDSNLQELKITPPDGMTLSSGSCTKFHGDISTGNFHFLGEVTIKGKISYGQGDMWEFLTFSSDKPPRKANTAKQGLQFGDVIQHLRFPLNQHNFDLPVLSDTNSCFEADAVLKIKSIEVLIGDSDEAGNWIRSFEVVELGKFAKCKPN